MIFISSERAYATSC